MAKRYVHFTDGQKTQARQTDLASFLRSQGETLKRSGSEYEWMDGSQKVTVRGNLWFHQYDQVGGDAIDFVRRFYCMGYPEAVEYLLGGSGGALIISPPIEKEKKPFALPPKNDNMSRVYAYLLRQRGIDKAVLDVFVQHKMIYESSDYHNAVFVGYDRDGVPRHAHKRGTGSSSTYKGNADGSMPEYSFHWTGKEGHLCLFEAPIDMLSFLSLYYDNNDWQSYHYAAACSVSDRVLFQCLKDNPGIKNVYLCLDNDEAGQKAAHRISGRLSELGIHSDILVPTHKDWNEDLLDTIKKEREVQGLCPASGL